MCRELTKEHEEFIVGRLEESDQLPDELLGEITVVVGPPEHTERTPRAEVLLLANTELAQGGKPRQVARRVQDAVRGWSGKEIYALLTGTEQPAPQD